MLVAHLLWGPTPAPQGQMGTNTAGNVIVKNSVPHMGEKYTYGAAWLRALQKKSAQETGRSSTDGQSKRFLFGAEAGATEEADHWLSGHPQSPSLASTLFGEPKDKPSSRPGPFPCLLPPQPLTRAAMGSQLLDTLDILLLEVPLEGGALGVPLS